MKKFLSVFVIVLLVAVDQLVKVIIDLWLKPIRKFELFEDFFSLTYVENRGAAFGMLQNKRYFFIILTSVVIIGGIIYLLAGKFKSNYLNVSVILIISGGIGNLIDRIFRGYVIDYIEPLFINFAVFNFADILVSVGAFMMIMWLIVDAYKDMVRIKKQKALDEHERVLEND